MLRLLLNRLKQFRCQNHEYEIVTRARESYYNGAGVEIEHYEDTVATCVHCHMERRLNTVRSNRCLENNQLIAVHRDPLGIYRGIKLAQKNN